MSLNLWVFINSAASINIIPKRPILKTLIFIFKSLDYLNSINFNDLWDDNFVVSG